jgi:hypothetical protein
MIGMHSMNFIPEKLLIRSCFKSCHEVSKAPIPANREQRMNKKTAEKWHVYRKIQK